MQGHSVDIVTTITIAKPLPLVAGFASNPDNAVVWYSNIKSVEWLTPRPLSTGSRVAFVARFLGRRLKYTYEIITWIPSESLVMRTVDGPFAMETSYTWKNAPNNSTIMVLRNRGEPTRFFTFLGPLIAAAMRRENRKDLLRLKRLLEQ